MRIQQNQGFTLVEILVAMTIFSIGVLGLAIGTVTLTRTNADSQSRATAINVAQGRLEEIKSMNSPSFTTLVTACPTSSSTGCKDIFSASGTSYERKWWFTKDSPVVGVNRVDVQVNWTDHGSRSITFTAAVPQ